MKHFPYLLALLRSPSILLLLTVTGFGLTLQSPNYQDLTTITGDNGDWLMETSIAAGPDSVMVVCGNRYASSGIQSRYAFRAKNQSGSWEQNWTQGLLPQGNFVCDGVTHVIVGIGDAYVAYNPASPTRSYGCVALIKDVSTGAVYGLGFSTFDKDTRTWTDWLSLPYKVGLSQCSGVDKPVICLGEPDEFYVVWRKLADSYYYARSRFSQTEPDHLKWTGGHIEADGANVTGDFAVHVSVFGNGRPFFAYRTPGPNGAYKFLGGVDRTSDGGVTFGHLKTPGGQDLVVSALSGFVGLAQVDEEIPTNRTGGVSSWSPMIEPPQLAVDPSNSGRIYFAYTDSATPQVDVPDHNMNVYLAVLTKAGTTWTSQVYTPLGSVDPVPPTCELDGHTDQFRPAITVDSTGCVHMTMYDDRAFCQDVSSSEARYDAYYGRSVNGGQTFEWVSIGHFGTNDAALKTAILDDGHPGPLEYNGITFDRSGSVDTIWASYAGSDVGEASTDKSVIYSFRAEYTDN